MACRSTRALCRAYKSPDKNSNLWSSATFDKVWRGMPATYGARVVIPSWGKETPLLSIDVTSSNESALNMLRLLAYDLVQPLNPSKLPILQTQCLLKCSVAVTPWAMPTSMRSPPEFLDGAVSHFRKLRREKLNLLAAHRLNFDAEEEYYDQWAEKVESRYNKERWCFGTLQDGFVAQNLLDHPELETRGVAATVARAKYLRQELPPLKKSMCIGADDDCNRWVLFGGHKQDSVADTDTLEEELDNITQLAFSSAIATADRDKCVWVHGDVVCNRDTGDAVLIVGPKTSGKTSLALHCLAASSKVNLTATDQCWLFPSAEASPGEVPAMRVCGLPLSPKVRLGTLLGTAMENPSLKVMDSTCIEAFGVVRQNSLETTWHHVAKSTRINIPENFGPGRVTPFPLKVKCVVVLNWETGHILPDGPCGVRQCTDGEDSAQTIISAAGGGEAAVLKGHTLLQWRKYDEAAGGERLVRLLKSCEGAMKVVEIGGHVSFGKATRFVLSELDISNAGVAKEYRKQ